MLNNPGQIFCDQTFVKTFTFSRLKYTWWPRAGIQRFSLNDFQTLSWRRIFNLFYLLSIIGQEYLWTMERNLEAQLGVMEKVGRQYWGKEEEKLRLGWKAILKKKISIDTRMEGRPGTSYHYQNSHLDLGFWHWYSICQFSGAAISYWQGQVMIRLGWDKSNTKWTLTSFSLLSLSRLHTDYRVGFLAVPLYFQYQHEKRVIAKQSCFLKKYSI